MAPVANGYELYFQCEAIVTNSEVSGVVGRAPANLDLSFLCCVNEQITVLSQSLVYKMK